MQLTGKVFFTGVIAIMLMVYGCQSVPKEADVQIPADQAALAETALDDNNAHSRITAVQKLTDQEALAIVAVHDKDAYVRGAAVKNLIDRDVLAKVAMDARDVNVRKAAEEKLTTPVEDDIR